MFTKKLNIKPDGGTYQIEEEIYIKDGFYRGVLKHDNVLEGSISIWTGKNMTGIEIKDFGTSYKEDKDWETILTVSISGDSSQKAYVVYETYGDTVDADDINNLQEFKANKDEIPTKLSQLDDDIGATGSGEGGNSSNNDAEIAEINEKITILQGESLEHGDKLVLLEEIINDLDIPDVEQMQKDINMLKNSQLTKEELDEEIDRLELMIKNIIQGDETEFTIPRITESPVLNELYYKQKLASRPTVSWQGDDWGSWNVSDPEHLILDSHGSYSGANARVTSGEGSMTMNFVKKDPKRPYSLKQTRDGKTILDTGYIKENRSHKIYIKEGDRISILGAFEGDVFIEYNGVPDNLRLSVYKNGQVEEVANKRLVEERLEDFALKDELLGKTGNLGDLETENKETLVDAINEIHSISGDSVGGVTSINGKAGDVELDAYSIPMNSYSPFWTVKDEFDRRAFQSDVDDLKDTVSKLESNSGGSSNEGVTSVNGKTGKVTLTTDDISESNSNQFVSGADKLKWNSIMWKADQDEVEKLENRIKQLENSPKINIKHKEEDDPDLEIGEVLFIYE